MVKFHSFLLYLVISMEMEKLEIQIQKIAWNAMYNKFLRLLFQLIENIR